jgi:hypothetical protein
MDGNSVSTIKVGIYLQGDGGASSGAIVLAHKEADNMHVYVKVRRSKSNFFQTMISKLDKVRPTLTI